MPSGPKKRKAAKKKQVKESLSTAHSHRGESDGGELSSPVAQDHQNHLLFTKGQVKKHEDGLSQKESVVVGKEKEEEGNIKIDKGSKLRKSDDRSLSSGNRSSDDDESRVFEKNVVVLESAPVIDSEKPADSLLKEEIVEEKSLVPEVNKRTFVEQTSVVNGSGSKDNCSTFSEVVESSLVETSAGKPPISEESACSKPPENVAHCLFNGLDRVNERETLQYSAKQPLVASAASKAVQTTSWKGCCGILELFSSSDQSDHLKVPRS